MKMILFFFAVKNLKDRKILSIERKTKNLLNNPTQYPLLWLFLNSYLMYMIVPYILNSDYNTDHLFPVFRTTDF